jgi:hypothetical protein
MQHMFLLYHNLQQMTPFHTVSEGHSPSFSDHCTVFVRRHTICGIRLWHMMLFPEMIYLLVGFSATMTERIDQMHMTVQQDNHKSLRSLYFTKPIDHSDTSIMLINLFSHKTNLLIHNHGLRDRICLGVLIMKQIPFLWQYNGSDWLIVSFSRNITIMCCYKCGDHMQCES